MPGGVKTPRMVAMVLPHEDAFGFLVDVLHMRSAISWSNRKHSSPCTHVAQAFESLSSLH